MLQQKNDSITLGVIVGFLLPLVVSFAIIFFSSSHFESIKATINHFQEYDILYKILSVSLMPGAGLFFIWSKMNKINQARGVLLMTLFYGVFVMLLYMA
jgi:hypothetical protein